MNAKRIFAGDYSFSTHDLPRGCRTGYWREQVSRTLIGVDCTASDDAGLNVSLSVSGLGEIGVAELMGNRHVVERNSQRIRSEYKNSAFICLQLQGSTHILQSGDCITVEAGDLFHYGTASPYVHGNTTDIHTLIVDLPIETLIRRCPDFCWTRPGKISHRLGLGQLALSGMREIAQRLKTDASASARKSAGTQLLGMLASLLESSGKGSYIPRSRLYVLLQAKAFIEEHLDDERLDCETVARAVGLSSRQLNRIFEHEETSVSRFIWRRRLERAHEDLMNAALRHVQVAEIAFRWGFSSAAHFSRVYRQHFGLPPAAKRNLQAC